MTDDELIDTLIDHFDGFKVEYELTPYECDLINTALVFYKSKRPY